MKAPEFGIVIKVNDLDLCRMFYRDVIGFGQPCFDSSFAVQFQLTGNLRLTLEKNTAPFLEHASAATTWFFESSDISGIAQRLLDSGFARLVPAAEFGSSGYFRGRDPENNMFYIKTDASEMPSHKGIDETDIQAD